MNFEKDAICHSSSYLIFLQLPNKMMKIVFIGFAVLLLGCEGSRVGAPKQLDEITSNKVAANEKKLYVRDETESLVRVINAISVMKNFERFHSSFSNHFMHLFTLYFDHRLKVALPSMDTGR